MFPGLPTGVDYFEKTAPRKDRNEKIEMYSGNTACWSDRLDCRSCRPAQANQRQENGCAGGAGDRSHEAESGRAEYPGRGGGQLRAWGQGGQLDVEDGG